MQEVPNTYQLEPKEDERFYPSKVQAILKNILEEKLRGVEYDAKTAPDVTEDLVGLIRAKVKTDLKMPRYKLAIKVVMGELKGQGIKVASKCLWDTNYDNYASYSFTNEKIYCCAIVYGCYYE